MVWQRVKISSFLKEREDRFEPEEANKTGLHRLEKIDFSGNIYINDNKPTKTGMILVKKGDLVISGINVEKGAVSVYQGEQDVLATIHYSSYQFDERKIDMGYFTWFLKSKAFIDAVNSQNRGGIKTELKAKKFLALEIDLPDIDTQRQIKDKLNSVSNEIDEVLENNYKNEKLIAKLKKEIFKDAISGNLVEHDSKDNSVHLLVKQIRSDGPFLPITEEEKPFQLPISWEWVRLGELIQFNYGKAAPPEDRGDIPVYGANGIMRYTDTKPLVNKRCIIVGRKGSVGAINVCYKPCFPSDVSYYVLENNYLIFEYMIILLKSLDLQQYGKGIKPGINRNIAYHQVIGFPPLAEQKRIVEKVNHLMTICDELEKEIKDSQNNSSKLIDAVLREAFEVN